MSGKKKISSRKKVSKVADRAATGKDPVPKVVRDMVESARMPSRVKETNEGFGVLKAVAGAIILLIVGATILANMSGAPTEERGTGVQDTPCSASTDCTEGHICYGYEDNPFQCLKLCKTSSGCGDEYQCVPVTRGNRKVKIKNVCVHNEAPK